MRSVVKHSYMRGRNLAARAGRHMNYIQYRPGEDDEKRSGAARIFHSPDRSGKASYEFREAFRDEKVVHKLMLSPGVNQVDMEKYTEEIMSNLGRVKGLDLRYGYVVHENTDHTHAHVIVLGKDKNGHEVRFTKEDHVRIRAWGDRYLQREHGLEFKFDSEVERFARQHGLNLMLEKNAGEQFYKLLEDDKRGKDAERDAREWEWLDDNWKQLLDDFKFEGDHNLGWSHYHDVGRLSEWHQLSQNTEDRKTWEEVQKNDPALNDLATQKLAELEAERQGIMAEFADKFGNVDPEQFVENIAKQIERDRKDFYGFLASSVPQNEPEKGNSLDQDKTTNDDPEKPLSIDDVDSDLKLSEDVFHQDTPSPVPEERTADDELAELDGLSDSNALDSFVDSERGRDADFEMLEDAMAVPEDTTQSDASDDREDDDDREDSKRGHDVGDV